MVEQEFVLFDRASRNQLGEFSSFEQAEEALLRWAAAAPESASELEIRDEEGVLLPVDPEKLRQVTAA